MTKQKVLSIQSHVVHGFAGNRCAVFCLQRLGIEVDGLNTVQFSNHTGYPNFSGQRLSGKELLELYTGLHANQLDGYTHLLTGYVGKPDTLRAVSEVVKRLRINNPDLLYVCDPVMGDDEKLYVPQELVGIYRDEIIPLTQVLLPNAFEVKTLTGIDVRDLRSAESACERLHTMGPSTVVVTSLASNEDHVILYASTKEEQDPGHLSRFKIEVPRIPGHFGGTGDVFSALTVGLYCQSRRQLDWVCEQAISRTHAIVRHTKMEASESRELALVAAQECLVQPVAMFHAIDVTSDSDF